MSIDELNKAAELISCGIVNGVPDSTKAAIDLSQKVPEGVTIKMRKGGCSFKWSMRKFTMDSPGECFYYDGTTIEADK